MNTNIFRVSAFSPTPISPTYYHSVPFHLLKQNVTKTVKQLKQAYIEKGIVQKRNKDRLKHWGELSWRAAPGPTTTSSNGTTSWSELQGKLTPMCSSLLRSSSKNSLSKEVSYQGQENWRNRFSQDQITLEEYVRKEYCHLNLLLLLFISFFFVQSPLLHKLVQLVSTISHCFGHILLE